MIHEVDREGSEAVGKGKGKQAKRHQRNQKDRNKGTGAEAGSSVPPFFCFWPPLSQLVHVLLPSMSSPVAFPVGVLLK